MTLFNLLAQNGILKESNNYLFLDILNKSLVFLETITSKKIQQMLYTEHPVVSD